MSVKPPRSTRWLPLPDDQVNDGQVLLAYED